MANVEYDDQLRDMASKENRPFNNKQGWRRRPPRCPECDAVMKGGRRSVKFRQFLDREYETCMVETCKPRDHLIVGKSKVYTCKACDLPGSYAAHPGDSMIHLRCKCKLDPEEEEQWNMMAMQVHLMRVHGMNKHDFVQHLYDSMRPIPLPVKKGQKLLVIGPELPTNG